MPTFVTPKPIDLTLEVSDARVRLVAGDRTETTVSVEPVDPSQRQHVDMAQRTTADLAGSRLRVATTTASGAGQGPAVAISIELPRDSDLLAKVARTQIDAEGTLGDVEAHLAAGQVRLGHIGALEAHVADGELDLSDIAGAATIDGGSGTVRIGRSTGPVTFVAASGSIAIADAGGTLELRNADGDLEIGRADQDVTVQSAAGAIRVGRLTRGRADLVSGSGAIEVGVDPGSVVEADATSKKGTVRDLVSTRGERGAGGDTLKLVARTRTGDIVLAPATAGTGQA